MRRVMAWAGVAALTMAGAACTPEPGAKPRAWPTPAAVVPARATAPGTAPGGTTGPVDRAATRRVCVVASQTAARGVEVFNAETARLERAAARDDQETVVAAATAIAVELGSMAATLDTLSRQPVASRVRAALVDAEETLTAMRSPSYAGTLVDQRAELRGLAAAFARACH